MRINRRTIVSIASLLLLVTGACLCSPRPGLDFLPDTLPDARVGSPYSVDILVAGNKTPVFQAGVSDGSLPGGLTLELIQTDHIIRLSGTPAETGNFTFTVSVSCYGTNVNGQTGEKKYTLVVGP